MLSIPIGLNDIEGKEEFARHISPADAELIAECILEKPLAQAALYKKYYGMMMAISMRYLSNRDNALEVLNNGFLKIFKNLKNYEGKGSFEGWMKRIIYHSVLDYIKQNATYKKNIVFEDYEASIDETAAQKLYTQDLLKLLDFVPIASRAVFNMYVIDGYKHEEIAKELGIAVGTSKWHLSEARKTLKEQIEKNY
jgi:RNA polymerase sigma-70 factor (ECF subfamily)